MNYSEMKKKELLDEITKLREEVTRLERYKQYEEAADETKAIYDSFVKAGFTNEQAFQIIITALQAGFKQQGK